MRGIVNQVKHMAEPIRADAPRVTRVVQFLDKLSFRFHLVHLLISRTSRRGASHKFYILLENTHRYQSRIHYHVYHVQLLSHNLDMGLDTHIHVLQMLHMGHNT